MTRFTICLLLAGCTTETNTALIYMLGDAVSSSATTGTGL